MQVSSHIYRLQIKENYGGSGVMHPGGTNIYFVGDPAEEMAVVDTGEQRRAWTCSILGYHSDLGRPKISAILITHGHQDHIGGIDRLQEAMSCPVFCHPKLADRLERTLGDEVVVRLRFNEVVPTGGGVGLRAVFTPGHEEDHVCYYLATDSLMFTGDTVLGGSSSTVQDMSAYMNSLRILASYEPTSLFPGHGPLVDNGAERIQSYIAHREERERQIVAALEGGLSNVGDIVTEVYPKDLLRGLREPAVRNVLAHLAKLKEEGRVVEARSGFSLVAG